MEKKAFENFIIKNNSLSLSRFIYKILYSRPNGYYQKKRIGEDFVTSPEISQMFGECIAIFLSSINKKQKFYNVCDLGPGNGTLTNDLVRTMRKLVRDKLTFFLYEKSLTLSKYQDLCLNNFSDDRIEIKRIHSLKKLKKQTIFLCNEFFDALPTNQYVKKKNQWFEKRISFLKERFVIIEKPLEKKNLEKYEKFKNDDILELSPLGDVYLKKIFRKIANLGGGALIFDYGPFQKKKINTLQAISKKKKVDFLEAPFDSDVTYHIDFQYIKTLASNFNLISYGPISQKKFLYHYGINERYQILSNHLRDQNSKNNLERQFQRLISPEGMGNLIKCIFVTNLPIKTHAFS